MQYAANPIENKKVTDVCIVDIESNGGRPFLGFVMSHSPN